MISLRTATDLTAFTTAWAAFFDLAPKIAAVLSIVWLAIQIGGWAKPKLSALWEALRRFLDRSHNQDT